MQRGMGVRWGSREAGSVGQYSQCKTPSTLKLAAFCRGTNRHIIASALTRSVRHLWPEPIHDRQSNALKIAQSLQSQSGHIKTPTQEDTSKTVGIFENANLKIYILRCF